MGAKLRMLLALSVRSLLAHRWSSLIVGGIVAFGAFLIVVGTSLLQAVESSMARSVRSSLAGDVQVYSAEAKDELALFGGFMGGEDVGSIDDFGRVRRALEALPEVKAVVPMGIAQGTVVVGNELDEVIARLRLAVTDGNAQQQSESLRQLREIGRNLKSELENARATTADVERLDEGLTDIARLLGPELEADLAREPEQVLTFLDTQIAPLAADGKALFLRVLGTDLDRFVAHFDRFRVVKGETVPAGKRGLLLSERVYEEQAKHRVARELDRMKEDIEEKGITLAEDALNRDRAKRLPKQYQRITYQLAPGDAEALNGELAALLPDVEGDLEVRLQAFLAVNDANFQARYAWFYEHIAPRIELYSVQLGDVLPLRSFTKAGFVKTVPVKVYGVFAFEGLEGTDLAGAQNLVDLVTFREMVGRMSAATRAELREIREEVGLTDVSRADAEAELFGDADALEVEARTGGFEAPEIEAITAADIADNFAPGAIDNGFAFNAAVLAAPGVPVERLQQAVDVAVEEQALGLETMGWLQASGIVGQIITLIGGILYSAILIIFIVAMVIVNNAMVMTTTDRTGEIGTMRAVGAERSFVLTMFMLEMTVLGFAAGAAGALAGTGVVAWLARIGIPAQDPFLHFLFSGPRLFPEVSLPRALVGMLAIAVASVLSTIYPSLLAVRVPPVVAMQRGD